MAAIRKRLAQAEDGFTLIEILFAIVLITLGILATAVSFDHSRRTTTAGERLEVMAHQAEAEIEQVIALPYANIGTTTAPTNPGTGDVNDPNNYVTGSSYNYDWTDNTKVEVMVTGGSSTLLTSTAWDDGRYDGTIYRYVTWVEDACAACAGSQDYKRITVVVKATNRAKPFISSTIKRNPA
jgi:prepilin-type N-terminal cleavage/methylation domain-containing protein